MSEPDNRQWYRHRQLSYRTAIAALTEAEHLIDMAQERLTKLATVTDGDGEHDVLHNSINALAGDRVSLKERIKVLKQERERQELLKVQSVQEEGNE